MKKGTIFGIITVVVVLALIIIIFAKSSIENIDTKKDPASKPEQSEVDGGVDHGDETQEEKSEEVPSIEEINDFASDSASINSNYRLATEEDKQGYKLNNVKVTKGSKISTVTGTIENINGSENVIIKLEYYDETGASVSSSNVDVNGIKKGSKKNFEITIFNNVVTDNYKVYIEYVGA